VRQFFGAAGMAAVASQLRGITGVIAILAAILAILRRGAVAGRMSASLNIGHNLTPTFPYIGRLRVGIVSSGPYLNAAVFQSNDVNPAGPFHRMDDLFASSRRQLVDFLETEIQLGFTFLDTAATARDLGHLAHFEQAKKDARKAADTISYFLDRVEDSETRATIHRRCMELEGALAAL
jgi:hypothetical protein